MEEPCRAAQLEFGQAQRHPVFRRLNWIMEACRHDSDNGQIHSAEPYLLVQNIRVRRKTALPEPVTEDDHRSRIIDLRFRSVKTRPSIG